MERPRAAIAVILDATAERLGELADPSWTAQREPGGGGSVTIVNVTGDDPETVITYLVEHMLVGSVRRQGTMDV